MLSLNRAWCSLGAGVPPSTDVRTLLRFVLSSCRRNHCWNRTGNSLGVLVNALQSVFTRQFSAERSGELFRSFAAKDSRKTLLTKRHTYCSLIRTCVDLVQKFLSVLILKARLIRNLLLNDRVHSIWKNRCWRTICFAVLTHSSHCEINDTLTIAWSRTGVHLVQKFLPVLV